MLKPVHEGASAPSDYGLFHFVRQRTVPFQFPYAKEPLLRALRVLLLRALAHRDWCKSPRLQLSPVSALVNCDQPPMNGPLQTLLSFCRLFRALCIPLRCQMHQKSAFLPYSMHFLPKNHSQSNKKRILRQIRCTYPLKMHQICTKNSRIIHFRCIFPFLLIICFSLCVTG